MKKIKQGMIVKTRGYRKYWIALNVNQREIKAGLNCQAPGVHLFSGYWYNKISLDSSLKVGKNFHHKDIACYGKITTCNQPLRVVGYARNSFLVRKLMR